VHPTTVTATAALATSRIVDLSVPIGPQWPAVWPGNPELRAERLHWFDTAPASFNRLLTVDEHVGTHWDAPAHFIPPPDSGHPAAHPTGRYSDEIPLERFVVPAAVIDATDLCDAGAPGWSPKLSRARIEAWEDRNGILRPGEGVLLHTGWSDAYYRPFPEGRAYAHAVMEDGAPAWPAIDGDAMALLVERGVVLFGADTPSAGPVDDMAAPHAVALGAGMVLVEDLIGLGALPARGALFAFLPVKLLDGSGGPGRAVAFLPSEESA